MTTRGAAFFAALFVAVPLFAQPAAPPAASAAPPPASAALPPASSPQPAVQGVPQPAVQSVPQPAVPASASASVGLPDAGSPLEVDAEAPPPEPVPAAVSASAAPSAPPAPPPTPAPSASAAVPSGPGAAVKLGDATVIVLRAALGAKSAEQRAREATQALKRAFDTETTNDVKVTRRGEIATLILGQTPILDLGERDAEIAGASSLDVHAAAQASALRAALASERQRSAIAKSVFSVSLVVFLGLIAFYLLRKVGEFAGRMQVWIENRSDRELSIQIQRIEVVRPAMIRSSAVLALSLGKWLAQIGIAYAWLVVVLSMFEATRNYTQRLTGFVVAPLSQLMQRLAGALPLLVVALIAAFAVLVLVRFVGLFFGTVARGETPLAWLPPDLAPPTSVLLRVAIVISALVFLAPIVTGDNEGALSRAGVVALVAIGLSSTPLLATALLGTVVLYGRRLRIGEFAELGGRLGRIVDIGLLEVRLETPDQVELRVPHLFCITRPSRHLGIAPRISIDVYVSPSAALSDARLVLTEAAGRIGREPKVEILSVDAAAAHFRVSATCDSLDVRTQFYVAAVEALTRAKIALGRGPGERTESS